MCTEVSNGRRWRMGLALAERPAEVKLRKIRGKMKHQRAPKSKIEMALQSFQLFSRHGCLSWAQASVNFWRLRKSDSCCWWWWCDRGWCELQSHSTDESPSISVYYYRIEAKLNKLFIICLARWTDSHTFPKLLNTILFLLSRAELQAFTVQNRFHDPPIKYLYSLKHSVAKIIVFMSWPLGAAIKPQSVKFRGAWINSAQNGGA